MEGNRSVGAHALAKVAIIAARGFVMDCHAAAAHAFTRPPFAHPMLVHQMRDSFLFGCGRHHFFPNRSFEAALSSMASAKSRFSFVFSFSSVFNRLASDAPIPPNLAFHL